MLPRHICLSYLLLIFGWNNKCGLRMAILCTRSGVLWKSFEKFLQEIESGRGGFSRHLHTMTMIRFHYSANFQEFLLLCLRQEQGICFLEQLTWVCRIHNIIHPFYGFVNPMGFLPIDIENSIVWYAHMQQVDCRTFSTSSFWWKWPLTGVLKESHQEVGVRYWRPIISFFEKRRPIIIFSSSLNNYSFGRHNLDKDFHMSFISFCSFHLFHIFGGLVSLCFCLWWIWIRLCFRFYLEVFLVSVT